MEFQEMVTELNSNIGKPVRIVSTIGGHETGGEGVLKDVFIPRPGNRQGAGDGSRLRVEFQDGRMFAVDSETVAISKVSKKVAEEGAEKSLNASEGDGEETAEAQDERETREAGKTVGARKTKRAAEVTEASSVDDEAEDESEDEETVEEAPKVKKKTKTGARVKKSK